MPSNNNEIDHRILVDDLLQIEKHVIKEDVVSSWQTMRQNGCRREERHQNRKGKKFGRQPSLFNLSNYVITLPLVSPDISSLDLQLKINYYKQPYDSPSFTINLLYLGIKPCMTPIWRVEFNNKKHSNRSPGRPHGLPDYVCRPNYSSWEWHRPDCEDDYIPHNMRFAQNLPDKLKTFTQVIKWFSSSIRLNGLAENLLEPL